MNAVEMIKAIPVWRKDGKTDGDIGKIIGVILSDNNRQTIANAYYRAKRSLDFEAAAFFKGYIATIGGFPGEKQKAGATTKPKAEKKFDVTLQLLVGGNVHPDVSAMLYGFIKRVAVTITFAPAATDPSARVYTVGLTKKTADLIKTKNFDKLTGVTLSWK